MNNLSLVPLAKPLPPKEETPARRRILLPEILLCAIAVFFYGMLAADYIESKDIDASFLIRLSLGDSFGGADKVYCLPIADDSGSAVDDNLIENDQLLDRLDQLALPADTDALSYTNTETPYEIDLKEMLTRERVIPTLDTLYREYGTDAPIVLILHTHATEAYADHAEDGYRTAGEDGVIGIGDAIARSLRKAGINTLHDKTKFDTPDFNLAYYSASLTIRDLIAQYPSIRYVIDVHRDSVTLSDGSYYAPITEFGGAKAAKIMFVVGTDYGGSGHTGWHDNLALATRLQFSADNRFPSVTRPINIRAASFNEQYSQGSLLLEVGSCANTYQEAEIAAGIFAEAFADEIKNRQTP